MAAIGFNISDVLETIAAGTFLSILGYIAWLWKKSIYGKFEEMKQELDKKQDKSDCIIMMDASTVRNIEAMKTLYSQIHDKVIFIGKEMEILKESQSEKLDLIIDRQTLLIQRFDHHIDNK